MLRDWNFRRAGLTILLAVATTGALAAGQVERVSSARPPSVSTNAASRFSDLDADGRYVAFLSSALNVVPGQQDTNGGEDVFLRDTVAGSTVLVSRSNSSPDRTASAPSRYARISADGRYVLFESDATDLVPGQVDPGTTADLFLYDRVSGATTLVSRSVSAARRAGNGASSRGEISADGRWILFSSKASDLVPGQIDSGPGSDVFLYDRVAGTTSLVSHAAGFPKKAGDGESSYAGRYSFSADGSQALFLSDASDLVPGGVTNARGQLYLFNRLTGGLTLVSHTYQSSSTGIAFGLSEASISADGDFIAFSNSSGQVAPNVPAPSDIQRLYLYDRRSGNVVHVAPESTNAGSPRLSADGRYLAFFSHGRLTPDQTEPAQRDNLFLYDRVSGTLTLVTRSLTSDSGEQPGANFTLAISNDGRFLAYESYYRDLVAGQIDPEEDSDVDLFLYDRSTRTNRLLSHAADSDVEAVGSAFGAGISAGGNLIAFGSSSGEIAGPDSNHTSDVFLYSRSSDLTSLVSVREGTPDLAAGFSRTRALSADGRFVLFDSRAANLVAGQRDINGRDPFADDDVFLFDRISKTTVLVSRSAASPVTTGNLLSTGLALSGDGRYALFASKATDLVPGQIDNNNAWDIFLFDRATGTTALVSHAAASPTATGDSGCAAAGAINPDGRFVAFTCSATNLVPGQVGSGGLFLYDRASATTLLVSHAAGSPTTAADFGYYSWITLSADGRFVAFTSLSTNLVSGQISPFVAENVFLFDRISGNSVVVSHAPASLTTLGSSRAFSPAISNDGRYVAFSSLGDTSAGPGGTFLFDRLSGDLTRVSSWSDIVRISADGRWIAFLNSATDVIPGVTDSNRSNSDAFLYDRLSGVTTLVSHGNSPNATANRGVQNLSISSDGNSVTFSSEATDLVPGFLPPPGGQALNVFLYRRDTGTTELVSHAADSPLRSGDPHSSGPFLSGNGQIVAFTSTAANLVPGDLNRGDDVFLYNRSGAAPGPISLPPCTLLDTRTPAGRPALRSDARRTLKVVGACGVPAPAKQVTVKVTLLQGSGKGNVRFYPGNAPVTAAPSGILRFAKGQTVTGTFTLPLSTNRTGTLSLLPFVADKGTVQAVVEVTGYVP
jgi:Tol biopolymer transport system component